ELQQAAGPGRPAVDDGDSLRARHPRQHGRQEGLLRDGRSVPRRDLVRRQARRAERSLHRPIRNFGDRPMMHLAVAALLALAQNDKTRANSYDDAWEAGWKAHCQSVIGGGGKTAGLVLHIGDSITYTMAYGSWIRGGAGKTGEDSSIITWFQGTNFPAGIDATVKSGIYLAHRDVGSNRSFTAAG